MMENYNHFNNMYNIRLNIKNEIIYLEIYNFIAQKRYNTIINNLNLIEFQISNINILYEYLKKCFMKEMNYILTMYETESNLLIAIKLINDEYITISFELSLELHKQNYDDIIESNIKYNYANTLNIPTNNVSTYFCNINNFLEFLCIKDDVI